MHTIKLYPKKTWLFKITLITSIILFACKPAVMLGETASAPVNIEKLLILPFKDMARIYGENVSIRCPLCGNIFTAGKVEQGADNILTDHLVGLIKNQKNFKLIPTSQAQGVLAGLLLKNKKALSEQDLLVETGRALNADVVMIGYIYRFRERLGKRYSVAAPASVAFDIHLISMTDGRILWVGHFDETQRSLSEDLFQLGKFLKRKAAWITAKELAFSGLENVLQACPNP